MMIIMAKGIIHDKDWNDKGIYGIFVDNELFYIGMTMDSFGKRFGAHRRHVYEVINGCYKADSQYSMYERLAKEVKDGKDVELRPLVCLSKLYVQEESRNCRPELIRRDVECMELAFISYFKPVLNTQGRTRPYPLHRI